MKGSLTRMLCATLLLSTLWLSSYGQNYYVVIGTFESESEDISTFAKNFVESDSIYKFQKNGKLGNVYILRAGAADQKILSEQIVSLDKLTTDSDEVAESVILENPSGSAGASGISAGIASSAGGEAVAPRGKYFKFTVDSDDGRMLNAPVHHVDLSTGKDIRSFETDKYVDVVMPLEGDEPMTVVCGVFGYKLEEKQIDYENPMLTDGAYRDENGAWVIPYKLERLKRGDVSTMYNVSFYRDAVAMLSESETDLQELVEMMQFNPDYEIKIHTYCNGKHKRSALALNDRGDYFDIEQTLPIEATAKELTVLRAEAIKSFLIQNGIAQNRIKTYGWGGNDMLVEADHPNARINDRVEIEVLRD